MFYQEAISWHAIENLLELTCFNYKMLSSLIVLYCLSSIPTKWGINEAIKRLIYHYPTHFLISIIYIQIASDREDLMIAMF